MTSKIDAVLIDTSAYHKVQCDFEGITNSIIPMFLRLLEANHIHLLTHPVLESEIKKHIRESEVVSRIGNLQTALRKYNKQLQLVDISVSDLNKKLSDLNLTKRLTDCFSSFYEKAVTIPFVDAKIVFDDYFNANPPFSATGDKKAEFPDAFVLCGLKEYCRVNPTLAILVISDDSDWNKTLENNEKISLCDSLESAILLLWEQLDNKFDLFDVLIRKTEKDIRAEIEDAVQCEAFCIDEIDTVEEVDIDGVSVVSIDEDIVPLEVAPDSVLLQIAATISVNGATEYLDESRSVWDNEDRCYYFCAYTRLSFKNAMAHVDCEIRINFSGDGTLSNIALASSKILNKWDINLSLEEADTEYEDVSDYNEEEYRAEQAEVLEEYYRH